MKFSLIAVLVVLGLWVPTALAQGKSDDHRPDDPGSQASEHRNVAAMAGGANAAHASAVAREHASPSSQVGKVAAYAELEEALQSGELQAALISAEALFVLAYPNF